MAPDLPRAAPGRSSGGRDAAPGLERVALLERGRSGGVIRGDQIDRAERSARHSPSRSAACAAAARTLPGGRCARHPRRRARGSAGRSRTSRRRRRALASATSAAARRRRRATMCSAQPASPARAIALAIASISATTGTGGEEAAPSTSDRPRRRAPASSRTDRRVLGVHRHGQAEPRGAAHAVVQRERVAGLEVVVAAVGHERLEADDAALGQLLHPLEVPRHEPAPEREVDVRRALAAASLASNALR